MKTTIKSITLAAFALCFTPQFTQAQDKPAEKPEGGRPGGPGGRSPEERLKMMTEKLGLTQEQQDKIKAIYAKNADAMKALREKGRENLTEEEKTKMREAMKAQMDEINAVLTEEQKTKMKEAFQRRGPGGPGGGKPGEGKPEKKD
jgi:Spy/CpxP family protein refolding chaperone